MHSGSRDDYNAWDLEGWSGEEVHNHMSKVAYVSKISSSEILIEILAGREISR